MSIHRKVQLVKIHFDSGGPTHSDISPAATARRANELLNLLPADLRNASGLRFLDVGCGSGELTVAVAHATGWQSIGMDFSDRLIRRARATFPDFHWILADAHRGWPVKGGSADLVLSWGLVQYLPPPALEVFFAESLRALKRSEHALAVHAAIPDRAAWPIYVRRFWPDIGVSERVRLLARVARALLTGETRGGRWYSRRHLVRAVDRHGGWVRFCPRPRSYWVHALVSRAPPPDSNGTERACTPL